MTCAAMSGVGSPKTQMDTTLDVTKFREPKGLYQKARQGEIPNFTSIDNPYEAPLKPKLCAETSKQTVEPAVEQIVKILDF